MTIQALGSPAVGYADQGPGPSVQNPAPQTADVELQALQAWLAGSVSVSVPGLASAPAAAATRATPTEAVAPVAPSAPQSSASSGAASNLDLFA